MKKCFGLLLLVTILLIFPTSTLAQNNKNSQIAPINASPTPNKKSGQLIIKFKSTITESTIKKKLKDYNIRILYSIDELSVLVVEVPKGKEDAILSSLKKEHIITYAEPDYIYRYDSQDEQKDSSTSAAIISTVAKQQWNLIQIHAFEAWNMSRGTGVKVGIIDSGFEIDHPALAGKILDTQDFSGENSLKDIIGHGTRVAAIIAGTSSTSDGAIGVCPDCQLLLAKLGANISSATVAKAIMWATKKGAKVINLSVITEGYSNLTKEAINYAWDKGVVIVAAAGNGGTSQQAYPAAYNNAVAVAAVDENDEKASFSNFGDWVMIAAPGVNIYTSQKNGLYGYTSGTSISSPIVAGVAGLIWASKYGTSNQAVVQRLCNTADKINGTNTYWRCGRINAKAAVQSDLLQEEKKRKPALKDLLPFILSFFSFSK
jgi:thermitase